MPAKHDKAQQLELLLERTTRSYRHFFEYMNQWPMPRHQQEAAGIIERFEATPGARIIVTWPPQHGKSECFTVGATTWAICRGHTGRGPITRAGIVSYNADKAQEFSGSIRERLENPGRLRDCFPTVRYTGGGAESWCVNCTPKNRPTCTAVGVGGSLTGRGLQWLVIDDPVAGPADVATLAQRDKLWKWYLTVALTRMHQDSRILVVMTRWHHDDLVGRLLNPEYSPNADKWTVYHYKAIDEEGHALWPEQRSAEMLEQIRGQMGDANFNCLYQGTPTAESGDVFRREWFDDNLYDPRAIRGWPYGPGEPVVSSWDTAIGVSARNDYTAWLQYALDPSGQIYITDIGRQRLDIDALIQRVRAYGGPSCTPIVEKKASGQQIIQMLQNEAGRGVIGVDVILDKVTRAQYVVHMLKSGRVKWPKGHPMLEALIAECTEFPNSQHDDLVDSLVLGLGYFQDVGRPITARSGGPRSRALETSRYANL